MGGHHLELAICVIIVSCKKEVMLYNYYSCLRGLKWVPLKRVYTSMKFMHAYI